MNTICTWRTSLLWLQDKGMVEIVPKYIKAERTGNWQLHLHALYDILSYFASSDHALYTKSAYDMYMGIYERGHAEDLWSRIWNQWPKNCHLLDKSEMWYHLSNWKSQKQKPFPWSPKTLYIIATCRTAQDGVTVEKACQLGKEISASIVGMSVIKIQWCIVKVDLHLIFQRLATVGVYSPYIPTNSTVHHHMHCMVYIWAS